MLRHNKPVYKLVTKNKKNLGKFLANNVKDFDTPVKNMKQKRIQKTRVDQTKMHI